MKTFRFRVLLPLLLVLPLAAGVSLARAGGWGVLSVRELPDYLVAGETVELSFSVLGHGSTPLPGLVSGMVRAVGEQTEVTAAVRPGDELGVYTVSLTVPSAGEWTLFLPRSAPPNLPTLVNAQLLPIRAVNAGDGAAPPPLAARERGERLFVAKGCVGCHVHSALAARGYQSIPAGPVLTGKRFPEAFLARMLADPQSVPGPNGAQRKMPNLGLRPQEIEALTAFLNAQG